MHTELAFKCFKDKRQIAQPGAYAVSMSKADLVMTLADNVRTLMKDRGDSQATLAARAGVSQRAIGDLLTYGKSHFKNPTIRTLSGIGTAYSLPAWFLLISNMPIDLLKGQNLPALIENYVNSTTEGRDAIDRIAMAEIRYAQAKSIAKKAS